MELRYTGDPIRYPRMTTEEVRESFLVNTLFEPGTIRLVYWGVERAIVGGIVPISGELKLEAGDALRAAYFAERREIGIINTGAAGKIQVDGTLYEMDHGDGLYIGRGSEDIRFESLNENDPAYYYLLSYPAHMAYPTTHAKKADAAEVKLGSQEESNKRTIYKYIHPDGIQSCQLVMGFTELEAGNVWNTMPAHTHERRTEIYFYFDMEEDTLVFHMMGMPEETRHVIVRNREAILSPSWSLHSGVGTGKYTFIWGMGGENQAFDDMDWIPMQVLK